MSNPRTTDAHSTRGAVSWLPGRPRRPRRCSASTRVRMRPQRRRPHGRRSVVRPFAGDDGGPVLRRRTPQPLGPCRRARARPGVVAGNAAHARRSNWQRLRWPDACPSPACRSTSGTADAAGEYSDVDRRMGRRVPRDRRSCAATRSATRTAASRSGRSTRAGIPGRTIHIHVKARRSMPPATATLRLHDATLLRRCDQRRGDGGRSLQRARHPPHAEREREYLWQPGARHGEAGSARRWRARLRRHGGAGLEALVGARNNAASARHELFGRSRHHALPRRSTARSIATRRPTRGRASAFSRARGNGWAASTMSRRRGRWRRATCCRACSTSRCCSRATRTANCAACPTSARIAATSWSRRPAAAKQIRCGYHSRRFDLAGRMTFMPEFEEAKNFPSPRDDLPQVPFAAWAGHGFAALDPAAPFEAFLGDMTARVGWMPVDASAARPRARPRLRGACALGALRRELSRGLPHPVRASRR